GPRGAAQHCHNLPPRAPPLLHKGGAEASCRTQLSSPCWTPKRLTRYISPTAVPFQSNFSMTESQIGTHARSPVLPHLANPSRVSGRRALFAILVTATMAAVMWLSAVALSRNGLGPLDFFWLALFLTPLPWPVIGFWTAAMGFVILRSARARVAPVTPAAARIRGDEPITASVALMACIRNEDPARIIR